LVGAWLLLFSSGAFAQTTPGAPPQKIANAQEFARNGRKLYYNLRSEGLVRYQCNLYPDWDLFFSKLNLPGTEADARREQFKKIKFQFTLGSANEVQLTHSDIDVASEVEQRRMYQFYSGMDKMVHGFFQTWSEFMLHNFLDAAGSNDVVLDDGDTYRIEGDTNGSHAVLIFGKDYVMREMRAITPEFSGTVRPTFSPSAKGLILTSFSAAYKPSTATESKLNATISYTPVNGLQLPKQVLFDVETGEKKIAVSFSFDNCTAEKH